MNMNLLFGLGLSVIIILLCVPDILHLERENRHMRELLKSFGLEMGKNKASQLSNKDNCRSETKQL